MSRSGYIDDDYDQWVHIKWRGQVASAIRGKRGQAFLKELIEALEAMPEKRLIADDLVQTVIPVHGSGEPAMPIVNVCAIGALGVKRGVDLAALDPEDYGAIADTFGIAHQLVCELEYINDEQCYYGTPEQRWQHVRDWVESKIKA